MRVAAGDFVAARRWAEERDLYQYIDAPLEEEPGDSTDLRMRKYELLVLARLLIATERPDEALGLLESLVPIAERRNRPGILIEIQVLRALAHRAQGDVDRALTALGRALALAEPEGYVRIFADEGEPALELLREAVARGIGADTAGRVLAASVAPGGARVQEGRGVGGQRAPEGARASLVEPLTGREMEVLRLLRTHLSSTEIAEELRVSANTARFHIKNIYGKLGVHGRSDAVERARELGLL
jgi:LuxR family maltose regulon positive regulatory protein